MIASCSPITMRQIPKDCSVYSCPIFEDYQERVRMDYPLLVTVIGLSVVMVIGLVTLVVLLLCRPDKEDEEARSASCGTVPLKGPTAL